jgi:hypothetical protein
MLAKGHDYQPKQLEGMISDNVKAFVQKYKIPVAIGTALAAGLIAYGISKAIKK